MTSEIKQSLRETARRAYEGKGDLGGLSKGVGAVSYDLKVGGMEWGVEAEKGYLGGLLQSGQSSTEY